MKLMARADELKAQLLRTSNETVSIDGGAMTNSEAALATPRPSLDQMWGLE
ncbi:MAG TPA: hypothetical protein VGZ68_05730 [Acidimicrobiales bacterium]|nr:hypothetical protein [Acidimicrobiales bacterium]